MELANTRGQSTVPSNSLPQVLRRHPLLFYFLLAFGLTWAYELPALMLWHVNCYVPWMAPAFFGPTPSALLMTAVLEGKPGVGRLLRGYVLWRVGLRWYFFVLLGIPALVLPSVLTVPGPSPPFVLPLPSFSSPPCCLYRSPCFQWPARRGSRLARVRPASLATAVGPDGGNAPPRVALGTVAPAPRPVRPRVQWSWYRPQSAPVKRLA
jgi:hypothetical protein